MRLYVLRDLLVAISFANLCYLKVWWDLLAPREYEYFFYDAPAAPVHYFAVIANVLILGLILWRLRLRRMYLPLMVIPLVAARNCLARVTQFVHPHAWLTLYAGAAGRIWAILLLGVVAAAVFLAVRKWRRLADLTPALLAALVVVFPIFCAQGVWRSYRRTAWSEPAAKHISAGASQAGGSRRVVWIIFDEWDYALSFVKRPKDLALPVFDRLASESMAATKAFPPAGRTNLSIPALLAGRLVSRLRPVGPGDAEVTFEEGTQPVSIRSLEKGRLPDAIVGWWFPYPRLFGNASHCESCETEGVPFLYGSKSGEVMMNQARTLVEMEERSPFGQSLFLEKYRGCYEFVMEHARSAVADPGLETMLIHVPAPHEPFFYDRKTARKDRANPVLRNYFDELALADRSMGELRGAMESAGVWDSSAVIVSSDHWYRAKTLIGYEKDVRVPFLVKLPGQKTGVPFDEPFNTVVTKQLIGAIEDGSVTDAAEWLHEHRGSVTESPYNAN
jgi:hypothetical protein